jgi:hypothetical protein
MADTIPRLAWQTFHVPKKGHTAQEYEDAFAGDPALGRFAIADGASESSFAGPWARLLVRAYVRKPGEWSAWLGVARKRWQARLGQRELPWYAQAKVEDGAFAAFLGVHFENGHWHAAAVGDSCLFQVRGDLLHRAFPIRRSRNFGNQPNLLGSRRHADHQARTRRIHLQGDWQAGDRLYLMTDSLACWFLEQVEAQGKPWSELSTLETADDFASWMDGLRRAGKIRNDDVTLIRIQEGL